jgi:two-component system, NarL family, sensor histidine kinase UhpB
MNSSARRDLLIVLVVSVLAAVICDRYDLSEALVNWAKPHERLQLDELPGILLAVAVALCWFASRRYAEAKAQLKLRVVADERLELVLGENQRLARRLLEAQENERKALARDLHDELGQYINAIKLDAVAIRESARELPPVAKLSHAMIANIDRIYEAVRGLIRQLRPAGLDELGVGAAIEHCVNEWRKRLNVGIDLAIHGDVDRVDAARGLVLYRLVQEALTNVARHAHASHVDIEIGSNLHSISIRIRDNGRGMQSRESEGLGLIGMRERVAALGGTVEARDVPDGGFCVRASLPLPAAGS